MKSLTRVSILAASVLLSSAAMANVNTGVGLSTLNVDDSAGDISLTTLNIHLGYTYDIEGTNFSIVPEALVGFGVGDDTLSEQGQTLDIELDSLVSFSVRGEYHASDEVTLFVKPVYSKVKMTGDFNDGFGQSIKANMDTDWDLGAGIGIDYSVTEQLEMTLSYEYTEHDILDIESDFETVSLGFRYSF